MTTAQKHMWLESHGYCVRIRAEFEDRFPAGLVERMAEYTGKYVAVDFGDDHEGFCLVSDDLEALIATAYDACQ